MAWIWITPEIRNTFASLGVQKGDSYQISNDCLYHLNVILDKLLNEDHTYFTFRRAIGFGQYIKNDLLPLLMNVKNNDKVLNCTIKILANLTVPVECLLSIEAMLKTHIGIHMIFELNQLFTTTKEAFADSRTTKVVLDHIRQITEGNHALNLEQCDSINNCLLLLRNILHIPEMKDFAPLRNNIHNQILWNLFTHHIDKIVLDLIVYPQMFSKNGPVISWGVTLVQLIAFIFKDQHVGSLHKLLNLWFESSLSGSSEDDESNTSPSPEKSGKNDASPMFQPNYNSRSSDNCNSNSDHSNRSTNSNKSKMNYNQNIKSANQKPYKPGKGVNTCMRNNSQRFKHPIIKATPQNSQAKNQNSVQNNQKLTECNSELSDRGYANPMEVESISMTNNNDNLHQKSLGQKNRFQDKSRVATILESKELYYKKLTKRSKTNITNMNGFFRHFPTDEDISNILKNFTIDFLLKGFNYLVYDLRNQLLTDLRRHIDKAHLFWLITYFLKYATQLELEVEHISSVLSYDIISYLIYEGAFLCEQLDIQGLQEQDSRPTLRCLYLVVTSIREYVQAIDMYRTAASIGPKDKEYLMQLQLQIASTEQFKWLFLLLLRQFNENIQSLQYLQDLIITNHISLLLLDNVSKSPEYQGKLNIVEHLQKFATTEIMYRYGLLLENFQNNSEFVNNCIFTMMHHVGGNSNGIGILFQPNILKTFCEIRETDYQICNDWSDLIEFVIHKFLTMSYPSTNSFLNGKKVYAGNYENDKSYEDCELLEFYLKSQNNENPFEKIMQFYASNKVNVSKESIIKRLCEHKLISVENLKTTNQNIEMDDIQNSIYAGPKLIELKKIIFQKNHWEYLNDVQKLLLDTCSVKLRLAYPNKQFQNNTLEDPIAYYGCLMKIGVPLIPWTVQSSRVHNSKTFRSLLKFIGFCVSETNSIYSRIPDSWTPDQLFQTAVSLGFVDINKLNFDPQLLRMNEKIPVAIEETKIMKKIEKEIFHANHSICDSVVRFTPITTEKNIDIPSTFVPNSNSRSFDRQRPVRREQRQGQLFSGPSTTTSRQDRHQPGGHTVYQYRRD